MRVSIAPFLDSPARPRRLRARSRVFAILFNEPHRITIKRIWNVDIALGMNMLEIARAGRPDDVAAAQDSFDRALAGEHVVRIEEFGSEEFTRGVFETTISQSSTPTARSSACRAGSRTSRSSVAPRRRSSSSASRIVKSSSHSSRNALRRSARARRSIARSSTIRPRPSSFTAARVLFANAASVNVWRARDAQDLVSRQMKELVPVCPSCSTSNVVRARSASVVSTVSTPTSSGRRSRRIRRVRSAQLVLVVDIHQNAKRAEAERRRIRRTPDAACTSSKASRSASVSPAGGIAHDFNNPPRPWLFSATRTLRVLNNPRPPTRTTPANPKLQAASSLSAHSLPPELHRPDARVLGQGALRLVRPWT